MDLSQQGKTSNILYYLTTLIIPHLVQCYFMYILSISFLCNLIILCFNNWSRLLVCVLKMLRVRIEPEMLQMYKINVQKDSIAYNNTSVSHVHGYRNG